MTYLLLSIIPASGDAEAYSADLHRELGSVVVRAEVAQHFLGTSEIQLLISVGAGALINQIARVLSQWLKSNEMKRVRLNGVDLQGYGMADILKLLQSTEGTDEDL